MRGLGTSLGALLLAGVWVASAGAQDATAYAQVLAAHVRPGLVAGIQLAVVDYSAVKADPRYALALHDLSAARLDALRSDAQQLAFWVNAYNLLAIKAVVDRYPVRSIKDGGSLLQPIWRKKIGTVGGREYSLDEIEHGILRTRFREPRVHFAIVCASLSCPDLRVEPYAAERLDIQLDDATRRFLSNPAKGTVPSPDGRGATVSSIFKWFAEDFGGAEGVARFIRERAGGELGRRLGGLTGAGLGYLDYDWSLNDARRAGGRT